MTDKTQSERIEELEQRVYRLEQAIQAGGKKATTAAESGPYDRYDRYVMENKESSGRPSTAQQRRLYQEAGIVDQNKIKQRMKRMDQIGAWE